MTATANKFETEKRMRKERGRDRQSETERQIKAGTNKCERTCQRCATK